MFYWILVIHIILYALELIIDDCFKNKQIINVHIEFIPTYRYIFKKKKKN